VSGRGQAPPEPGPPDALPGSVPPAARWVPPAPTKAGPGAARPWRVQGRALAFLRLIFSLEADRDGPWRAAWRSAGRTLRAGVLAGLGAALLLLGGAGGLAWRLSRGPVALDWLAPRVEAAARARGVSLSLAGLALGWSGFRDPGAPLRVVLRGVRVGPPDRPVVAAERVDAGLSLAALAGGRVEPSGVAIEGARVELVRETDGLHLADGTALPGLADAGAGAGTPRWLAGLNELLATDTRVSLVDRPSGVTWAGAAPRIAVRREGGRLVGDAGVTLSARGVAEGAAAGMSDGLLVSLRPDPGQAGWSVLRAHLDPFVPAALGRLAPGLPQGVGAALAALDAPATLDAGAALDAGLSPRHYGATLAAGAGRVAAGGAMLGLAGLSLRGEGTPEAATLTLERLAMAAPAGAREAPPTFAGTATLRRDPGDSGGDSGGGDSGSGVLAQISLGVDHVAFAELADYWPAGIARDVQAWVTRNITAATAHDGHVELTLRAAADGSDARLVAASGELLGDDATLHWLRPVPPLEHMQARLVLEGPDALSVATQGGSEAGNGVAGGPEAGGPKAAGGAAGDGVHLGAGMVRITGLSARDQVATIGVDLGGDAAALVRLLSHPRLHLLSKHPPGFTAPRGRFESRLALTIPLESGLDADRIGVRSHTHLAAVHLGAVAAGQSLDDGVLDLDVTAQGLAARGTGTVARIPVRLTLDMDFRAGGPAQVVQRATLRGEGDAARLGAAGVDLAGVVEGPVGLSANYAERRNGRATVAVAADLSAAALAVPLGWSKPAGPPAEARGVLLLDHGRLRGVESLRATAPGLALRGRAEGGDGRVSVLRIEHAAIGRTEASGTVSFPQRPGGAVRASVSGAVLDLSARFGVGTAGGDATPRAEGSPASSGEAGGDAGAHEARAGSAGMTMTGQAGTGQAGTGRAGTPWVLDARFDRVLLARGRSIAPVAVHVEDDGRRIDAAQVRAGGGAGSVLLTVAAQPAPGRAAVDAPRHVEVQAADAGALLSSLDVTDAVRGGRLNLAGTLEGRSGRADGTLRVDDLNVTDAPAVGRLLQAVTVYGIVDLLHGPGLHLGRVELPFRVADHVVTLHDARATSASLGATASGQVDLAARSVDLSGTVVPAYFFNQLPGRLPLVGRLFSPEPGGGVFAVTYTVKGPLDEPKVSVNPMAALAPGFVRRLLGLP